MATTVEPTTQEAVKAPEGQRRSTATKANALNRRLIAVGAGVVAVGLGAWVVLGGGQRKEEFAGRALSQARSAAEAGNLPLASSEFQKLIQTYEGTEAAQEAVIGLNQVRMINGQSELAVAGLREFIAGKPEQRFLAPAYGLLGAALENSAKPAEAAQAYMNASNAAGVDYLKAEYLVNAGRAFRTAGRTEDAAKAYQTVIDKYKDTAMLTEAQVRLAEMTAATS